MCAAVIAVGGCAAPAQFPTQWVDPGLGPSSRFLQDQKVLVVCEVFDPGLASACQDQLYREVQAHGAMPVTMPPGVAPTMDRQLESAQASAAKAVFSVVLTPTTTNWGGGSGALLGIGGFSGGRGGGGGIGLSVPIGGGGGGWTSMGSVTGRVTEASTGRMVWTSSFVPSAPLDFSQMPFLTRAVADEAARAGLF